VTKGGQGLSIMFEEEVATNPTIRLISTRKGCLLGKLVTQQ
jgi:hypothetical protein